MKITLIGLIGMAVMAAPTFAASGNTYILRKQQLFTQTTASGVTPAFFGFPFELGVMAPTAATLKSTNGSALPLVANANDGSYQYSVAFTTQAALEAAFPPGTFSLSGAAFSTVNLPLSGTPSYPASIPQVVGGTWQNGVLMLNAGQDNTINFSTFNEYATAGVAGHMSAQVSSENTDNVNVNQQIATQSLAGLTATPKPFTSLVIPKNTLQPGLCYIATVAFDTFVTLDTTSNGGALAGGYFSNTLAFFIAATPTATVPAPAITTQPANQTAAVGGKATFTAGFTFNGSTIPANVAALWFYNGLPVDYSTGKYTLGNGSSLVVNNVTTADAGAYSLVMLDAGGLAQTQNATLTVSTGTGGAAPTITGQPLSVTVNSGSTVALKVTASSAVSYQWSKNGVTISGATSDTLLLPGANANAGSYTVAVTNGGGTVTSSAAAVAVTSGQISRISNLSVRTNLASGQTLTVGFVTSGSKNMLIRAVGPSLNAVFGLTGFYADPKFTVLNGSGATIAQNDDWNSSLSATFASLGAFGLTPGSKDAALALPISGPTTAQINGTGSGVMLVEVYDADAATAPFRLTNVSARNQVGTGGNVLISGFVIDGSAARTLLIRGIGPALHDVFGVSGFLPDPYLEIHTTINGQDTVLASNDNWNQALAATFSQVGAYQFNANSLDAALLITLPPGVYTAQVAGNNNGTGDGVVEVYEVP
jgi:hypothetical protein